MTHCTHSIPNDYRVSSSKLLVQIFLKFPDEIHIKVNTLTSTLSSFPVWNGLSSYFIIFRVPVIKFFQCVFLQFALQGHTVAVYVKCNKCMYLTNVYDASHVLISYNITTFGSLSHGYCLRRYQSFISLQSRCCT